MGKCSIIGTYVMILVKYLTNQGQAFLSPEHLASGPYRVSRSADSGTMSSPGTCPPTFVYTQPSHPSSIVDKPNSEVSSPRHDVHRAVLPQDVMDSMVDALADLAYDGHDPDARKALVQCLSVSRSFYSKARPRVFHSITRKEQILPCENWDFRRDDLFFEVFEGDLLRQFRPLATQVHEMTIVACFPTNAKMTLIDSWSSSQEELDKRRERIPHILDKLTSLDAFEIRADGFKPLIWSTLYLGMKFSIRKICHTTRILRFHNIWGFPLSLLGVCVNLKELSLSKITELQTGICKWDQKAFDNLEFLEIAEVGEELFSKAIVFRPAAFRKLIRLKVTLPSINQLSTILECSVDSLKILEIFSFESEEYILTIRNALALIFSTGFRSFFIPSRDYIQARRLTYLAQLTPVFFCHFNTSGMFSSRINDLFHRWPGGRLSVFTRGP